MKTFLNIVGVILLIGALTLGIAAAWETQSAWFFSILRQSEKHDPLALILTDSVGNTETKSMEEWLRDDRVMMNNTLILVNSNNPLPEGYKAELQEYNGAKMHPSMVDSYIALRDTVQNKTGIRIYVSADYRTSEEQKELLEIYGPDRAAAVGCSEHEAGLALDVYSPEHSSYSFLSSPAGREVNRICHQFGFIIRYEVDKTDVTGFDYEPWHLRYVGAPHAELIAKSGLAYEEYLEAIKPEVWYSYGNYLILRTSNTEEITLPASFTSCHISPDNTGYYIVTIER